MLCGLCANVLSVFTCCSTVEPPRPKATLKKSKKSSKKKSKSKKGKKKGKKGKKKGKKGTPKTEL